MIFPTKKKRVKQLVRRVQKAKHDKHKYGIVMDEFKAKRLYSSSGYKVTNPAQARAIAFSYTKKGRSWKSRSQSKKKTPIKPVKRTLFSRLKTILTRRKGAK
jgi:hypothetical protein